jgi:hypothetical protein
VRADELIRPMARDCGVDARPPLVAVELLGVEPTSKPPGTSIKGAVVKRSIAGDTGVSRDLRIRLLCHVGFRGKSSASSLMSQAPSCEVPLICQVSLNVAVRG